MSEPVRLEYGLSSDSIPSNGVRTAEQPFTLPSVLRAAAYISSGGRVYRLFSDGDDTSIQMASFGELFRFNPLPEPQPLEDLSMPPEISPETSLESVTLLKTEALETETLETETFEAETLENTVTNSLTQLFASADRKPTILSIKRPPVDVKTASETSEKNVQKSSAVHSSAALTITETTTKTVKTLSPVLKPAPTLKLFEVFPESKLPETKPVQKVDEKKKEQKPELKVEPIIEQKLEEKIDSVPMQQPVAEVPPLVVEPTPVVQIIRLEIHNPRKPKQPYLIRELPPRPESRQTEEPVTELTPEPESNSVISVIESVSVPTEPVTAASDIKTETIIDREETIVVTKTITEVVTESVAQSIAENVIKSVTESREIISEPQVEQPETTIHLIHEPNTLFLPATGTPSAKQRKRQQRREEKVWQLTWQPHWPEHLRSLELKASDQICFLADHLEIQQERGSKIVSFNGFRPGDGSTTLALCAARELAERGYRLLLADAHRRNPELPKLLRLHTDPHLYEIITLIQDHLELLPWTETVIEVAEQDGLYTRSFTEIVGSFRNDYDFILLDNGSLTEFPLAERVLLWREMCSDGVLLVLNMKEPAPVDVRTIAHRLHQYRVELLGVAENYT